MTASGSICSHCTPCWPVQLTKTEMRMICGHAVDIMRGQVIGQWRANKRLVSQIPHSGTTSFVLESVMKLFKLEELHSTSCDLCLPRLPAHMSVNLPSAHSHSELTQGMTANKDGKSPHACSTTTSHKSRNKVLTEPVHSVLSYLQHQCDADCDAYLCTALQWRAAM